MSERHILVVDDDKPFVGLLLSALATHEVSVEISSGAEDCLDKVAAERHDLLIIAVDAPDKAGFTLFNRVRGLIKSLPVAIVTSTLPKRELSLHQKLKIHADDYWDKRHLTAGRLLERIGKLIDLGPGAEKTPETGAVEPEAEEIEVVEEASLGAPEPPAMLGPQAQEEPPRFGFQAGPASGLESLESGADLTLPQLQALLEELRNAPPPPAPSGDAQQVDVLRQELKEVRRLARTSPFGRDFVKLVEGLKSKDLEILDLQRQVQYHAQTLAATRQHTTRLAEQLMAALRAVSTERERVRAAEGALQAARNAVVEHRSEADELRRQQDGQMDQTAALLAQEQELHAETRRNHAAALAACDELRQEKAQVLAEAADQQREALAAKENEHQAALRRAAEELAAQRSDLLRRLDESQKKHEAQVKTVTALQAEEMAKLRHEHEAAMVALRTRLTTEKAQALEAAQLDLQRAYERDLEQRDAAARGALERREAEHQTALKRAADEAARSRGELTRQTEEERHRLESQLAERDATAKTAAARAADLERRLAQAQKEHADELTSLTARHSAQLRKADEARLAAIKETEARAEQSEKEAVASAAAEWERRLDQFQKERAGAVAQARAPLEQAMETLRAQHQKETATRETEHLSSLRQASDELVATRASLERRLDEARREHESRLSAVKERLEQVERGAEAQRRAAAEDLERRIQQARSETAGAVSSDWRLKLEQATAQQESAAARQRQEQAQALAAREQALREAGERAERAERELAALKSEVQELREKAANARSAQAEAQKEAARRHEAAVEKLEALMNEKRVAALAALEDEWQKRHEDMRRQHAEAMGALRRDHEKTAEEIKAARAERQQLQDTIAQQALAQKQAKEQSEDELQALEALMVEQRSQTVAAAEAEWRKKLEQAQRGAAEAGRQEADQARKEADAARQEAEKARAELAAKTRELERVLETHKRELADNAQTVASLRAMIGDFSGQALVTAAASAPPPAGAKKPTKTTS